MIKAGFIGAGKRAKSGHYPSVYNNPDVSIEAVSELDPEKISEVVDMYNIPNSYLNYSEMLENHDLDAVYLITDELHVTKIAIDCMNQGKHILIEKPPGSSPEDIKLLHDSAISNNVICMVGFQRRYAPVVQKAVQIVKEFGQPTLAISRYHKWLVSSSDFNKEPRSTMWSDVCHVVDLTRFMLGGKFLEINAYQDNHGAKRKVDYNSMIRFENDAVGIISANRSAGGRILRTELHGFGVSCYMEIPDRLEIIIQGNEPEKINGLDLVDDGNIFGNSAYDGTYQMHKNFTDCIKNKEIPITDIRDVISSFKLISILEGK